ncbi:hypothetical protein VUR80DRAFT_3467 [Thermomyces stellatus]
MRLTTLHALNSKAACKATEQKPAGLEVFIIGPAKFTKALSLDFLKSSSDFRSVLSKFFCTLVAQVSIFVSRPGKAPR